MNESEIYLAKEYKFGNSLCSAMDSILDNYFSHFHTIFSQKVKSECLYDIQFKNIANNELINFSVSGKNMDLFDLNNKFKNAPERGLIFVHINRLTIEF